jgi:hypothetical protein
MGLYLVPGNSTYNSAVLINHNRAVVPLLRQITQALIIPEDNTAGNDYVFNTVQVYPSFQTLIRIDSKFDILKDKPAEPVMISDTAYIFY